MLLSDSTDFYRRNLPHWHPTGAVFFVTYRLHGSLPAHVLRQLDAERQQIESEGPDGGEDEKEWHRRVRQRMFQRWDDYLDQSLTARWLDDERIAEVVRENLYHHAGTKYSLWAYVVMPNHVHVLLEPAAAERRAWLPARSSSERSAGWQPRSTETAGKLPRCTETRSDSYKTALSSILHSLRSYTANSANKILCRSGPFWDREPYDRWIRDGEEFEQTIAYIEQNPVKAGLRSAAEEWRFSSAYDRRQRGIGAFDRLA